VNENTTELARACDTANPDRISAAIAMFLLATLIFIISETPIESASANRVANSRTTRYVDIRAMNS
jgi:hypothetical protein